MKKLSLVDLRPELKSYALLLPLHRSMLTHYKQISNFSSSTFSAHFEYFYKIAQNVSCISICRWSSVLITIKILRVQSTTKPHAHTILLQPHAWKRLQCQVNFLCRIQCFYFHFYSIIGFQVIDRILRLVDLLKIFTDPIIFWS